MKYVHLHNHTEASIADGLFGAKKWVEALKTNGFTAHAVTDHGTMTSLLPFYHLMKKEKMIPILGVEFYYVDDPLLKNNENRKNAHLILIAKTYDGFRNLNKLMKLAYTEGYYYKPRIGREWLAKHSEDLICLTACQGGVLAQEVWHQHKGRDKGIGVVERFKDLQAIFGKDLYVEFQSHHTLSSNDDGSEFDSQALINEGLYQLKSQKGFQQIVTNDCHYILPKHANIQRLIKETSWKGGAKDGASDSATVTKEHFTDSLWLKKPLDIYKSFLTHHEYLPKAFVAQGMRNTIEVLEKCKDFALPSGKRYLPSYKPDDKKKTSKRFFKELTVSKLEAFLKTGTLHKSKKEYIERYKKELGVISKYNLEDYFLIVWDLIRFAKENGIYVGLGRGSSAGCLISYLLGIVQIDPLEYGLIFERFLNENRCESGELPDIDLDFESDRRKEIKEYIFKKYGEDHVCEIGTYGRMKLKTAIIDFGKSLEIANHKELLNITTAIDLEKEDVDDLDKAIEADPRLEKLVTSSSMFEFVVKETIGQIKSQGVHPAGLVICSEPIAEITPLKSQLKKIKPEDADPLHPEKDKRILVTQSEDKHIIAQGLMKMDVLGLKEYDVIKYVIENNPESGLTMDNYVQKIMSQEMEKPNKKVWKMFQQGKTEGVFQFASDGMKDLLVMMRPDSIKDLIAANALFRPGCLENGWHIQYCNRKKGDESVEYVHEDVEAALGETYGVIVYQEQFMEVIHRLGDISLVESDIIRSALGKKDKEKLAKFSDRFIEGAKSKIGESRAKQLWEQIEKASGYSFNKSHSAAYSVLAYISQYLKVHYPAHFWAAQLDWDTRKNKLDDMLVNKRAAAEMDVGMKLPHINDSKIRFTVKGDRVVWSLSSVKGVGYKAATEIQKKQPYKDFEDFCNKVSKNLVKQNIIQSLVYGGAFDEFGDRKSLIRRLNARSKKKDAVVPSEEDLINLFAKSMGFFERKIKKVREEKFSEHCITESELRGYMAGEYVVVGGMIQAVRKIKTKKGDDMGFLTIVDLDELIDVTVFPQMWKENRELMREGNIVQVSGNKSSYGGRENSVEADKIILC